MGGSYSQGDYHRSALQIYEDIQYQTCLFPDIAIDESLLKYSASGSNAALQALNKEMLYKVPDYARNLASVLGPLTSIPNAVGLGALVISMIIELIIRSGTQTSVDTYSLLRRVFGEEKASRVRDTMTEYLKRHEMHINETQELWEEIKTKEPQLSDHLTVLRNSLLHDGQMSSRGFKIWVNGAAFHVQMLIHKARLDVQAGKPASDCVPQIKAAIEVYLRFLDVMLEEYKTFKINSNMFVYKTVVSFPQPLSICYMKNTEIQGCMRNVDFVDPKPCALREVVTDFMDIAFSKYKPMIDIKSYFLDIKNNLYSRIVERGSFTVPPGKR